MRGIGLPFPETDVSPLPGYVLIVQGTIPRRPAPLPLVEIPNPLPPVALDFLLHQLLLESLLPAL
jgi:hypothetical protein